MKSSLKVLQIVEAEAPELLSECVNSQLFEALNMQPIPVLIQSIANDRTHGFCSYGYQTDQNEIVIAQELFDVRSARLRSRQLEEILNVYIHECAHRLSPNHYHNGAFLCINMLLHLRAGGRQIWHVNVYDLHEEKYFSDAWKWAWTLANELYQTDNTAEQCAQIILQKYAEWVQWIDGEEDRAAELHARKALAIDQRNKANKANENTIKLLRQDRWIFAFYSFVLTLLTISFLN